MNITMFVLLMVTQRQLMIARINMVTNWVEKILSVYKKYKDKIDDDLEFRKNLEVEIGGLLLDMKSVIANDERTRKLLDKVTEGRFDLQPND